jgi:hypothetical protein
MPADPAIVTPPEHALPKLATFELTRYRRELERALKNFQRTPKRVRILSVS